jgi:tetratricopeptide (TPR) repeat protein
MKRLYNFLLFIFLFSCQSLFAQFPEKDRTEVKDGFILLRNNHLNHYYGNRFGSTGNMEFGHIIDVPIKYCFINCFGEIYLWISQYPRKIKSSGYYEYEGKSYKISEYVPSFNIDTYDNFSPYIDLIVIVTVGNFGTRVAEVKVTNLISWDFGGCLGQSIPLVDDGETKTKNGWSNQDILPYLKELQIMRMEITEGHSRDYEIEEAIRQKLFEEKNKVKQNQIDSFYNEFLKEANAILAQNEYEKAKAKFKQASDLKKNESYPISKIAEIDMILEKQKAKIKFDKLVAEGDAYASNDKKYEARKTYREALTIIPNDPVILSKLEALGKDNIEEKLAEVKRLTNNQQVFVQGFSQWYCNIFLGSGGGEYLSKRDIRSKYYKTSFDYGVNKIFIENADQKNTNVIILPLIEIIEILEDYPEKEYKWCGSTPEHGLKCDLSWHCGYVKPVDYLGISLYDKNTRNIKFLVKAEDAEKVAELLREVAIESGAEPFEIRNYYKQKMKKIKK